MQLESKSIEQETNVLKLQSFGNHAALYSQFVRSTRKAIWNNENTDYKC